MTKELLERRIEEEKKAVTWKLPVSKVNGVKAYAKWKGYSDAEVVEALVDTLLTSREFNEHFHNDSNGKGK